VGVAQGVGAVVRAERVGVGGAGGKGRVAQRVAVEVAREEGGRVASEPEQIARL
jgi:hypothetical protein